MAFSILFCKSSWYIAPEKNVQNSENDFTTRDRLLTPILLSMSSRTNKAKLIHFGKFNECHVFHHLSNLNSDLPISST